MTSDTPTPENEVSDRYRKVAEVEDVPPGEGLGVSVDGIEIAIFRVEDEFYALSNRCAHQNAPLCKAGDRKINAEHTWTDTRGGVNEDAMTVSCPWHLWEWNLETGSHTASGKRIGTFECKVEDQDILVQI